MKKLAKSILTAAMLYGGIYSQASADMMNSWDGCGDCCYPYGINPPVFGCDGCGCNLFFTVDYLYWEVRTDDLEYATHGFSNATATSVAFTDVDRVSPDPGSGVRIGFNYFFPCWDCWEFSADWTYANSHAIDDVSVVPPANFNTRFVVPTYMNKAFAPVASAAHGRYDVYYNTVDGDIGREFCVGKRLSLNPHVGFRGAWIAQHFTSTYFNVTGSGGLASAFITAKNNIYFKGFGLRAGIDSTWDLMCGFSLIARSSVDLLWSSTEVTLREINPNGTLRSRINDKHIHTMTPVFELFLGLGWDLCTICNWHSNIYVGWEEQYYARLFQLNQFINPFDGDFSLHTNGSFGIGGLVVGMNFGF